MNITELEEFVYPLIKYAQHNYYEYASAIRILDVFIGAIVKNLKGYMTEPEYRKYINWFYKNLYNKNDYVV